MGVLDILDEQTRSSLKKADPPSSPKPMLATLTDRRFSDPDWIYERKLDGERCLAVRSSGDLRLVSRNGKRLSDTYKDPKDVVRERPGARG